MPARPRVLLRGSGRLQLWRHTSDESRLPARCPTGCRYFHQVQLGRWRRQSPMYFQKEFGSIVAASRGSACDVVIGREAMNSWVENFSSKCQTSQHRHSFGGRRSSAQQIFTSTPVTRLRRSAFTHGVLHRGRGREFQRSPWRDPRHFYSTCLPCDFRRSGLIVQQLFKPGLRAASQRQEPGLRFGTGTWCHRSSSNSTRCSGLSRCWDPAGLVRVQLCAVRQFGCGDDCTASFNQVGPADLGKSQSSLAKLPVRRARAISGPSGPRSSVQGLAMEQYLERLGVIKCLTGGDPITVEQKYRDLRTVNINARRVGGLELCSGRIRARAGRLGLVGAANTAGSGSHSSPERRSGSRATNGVSPRNFRRSHGTPSRPLRRSSNAGASHGQEKCCSRRCGCRKALMADGRDFSSCSDAKHRSWLSTADFKVAAKLVLGEELDLWQLHILYRYCRTVDGVLEKKRRGFLGFKTWPFRTGRRRVNPGLQGRRGRGGRTFYI